MFFFIFTFGSLLISSLAADDFGYDQNHGPSHWGDNYKTCLGKYQSPIDIEEKDVKIVTFPPFKFSGVDRPYNANMVNNGHTVMFRISDTELPMISGGPINDTYVFQQLHFHWGQNDNVGSEDLINNRSFSMEMHAVFYKHSYGSPAEAMKHPDGLTVLGYLYEATDKPNPVFHSIVSQIPGIEEHNSSVTINDLQVLSKLIAPDIDSAQDYFTYKGSLTTPPCLEIVQWIDFIKPQSLSHDQLAAFRRIQSPDGQNLTHNFRPVQPLDGRVVYRNGLPITDGTTSTTLGVTTSTSGTARTSVKTTPTVTTTVPTISSLDTIVPTISGVTGAPRDKNGSHHSGQQRIWTASPVTILLGILFLLPYQ